MGMERSRMEGDGIVLSPVTRLKGEKKDGERENLK
jgi:hypothetical protein